MLAEAIGIIKKWLVLAAMFAFDSNVVD